MLPLNSPVLSCSTQILTKFKYSSPLLIFKRCLLRTFKFSDLEIQLCPQDKLKPKPQSKAIVFGKYYTDHMLEVEWSLENGWGRPLISPLHDLIIHPGAKVFHYAIELFEGMKAFRTDDNRILLFRPNLNILRMLATAERLCLPGFNGGEFLACLRKLLVIEKDWVPSESGTALYIRPTLIGTDQKLGIGKSSKALLFIILSPVGSYFPGGIEAVSLLADDNHIRSWPGGVGDYKMGANYAATISVQEQAFREGCQQILWLAGQEHYITESGATNLFIFLINDDGERELITPPLDGLILPGIIRQSLLDLVRQKKEFKVTVRRMTMGEVIKLLEQKRLLEVFATGTACVICPIKGIRYKKVMYNIPSMEQADPIYAKLMKELIDIQYGRVKHKWSVDIEGMQNEDSLEDLYTKT